MSRLLRIFALAVISLASACLAYASYRGSLDSAHPELFGIARPRGCIVPSPLIQWHSSPFEPFSHAAHVDYVINLILFIVVGITCVIFIARITSHRPPPIKTNT